MRLNYPSIVILTCVSCVGFYSTQASTATTNFAPEKLEVAQVSSTSTTGQVALKPGSQGPDVQTLQMQLKQLGYYSGIADGKYGDSTKKAVAKFQQAKVFSRVDGVADLATKRVLQTALIDNQNKLAVASSSEAPVTTTNNSNSAFRDFLWWSILGLGTLGTIGAILYLLRRFDPNKPQKQLKTAPQKALSANQQDPIAPVLQELAHTSNYQETTAQASVSQTAPASFPATVMPVETTSRLAKLNIVDELVQDLRSTDPKKRHKAIWDLGQQGDSRAIQPLVNMLIDADSQQRNLILAALSEINVRSLKPINKAFAVSMQDESPQVRQNAIRDLTRVYDMMAQMSQMLAHALDDPDAEVQATARYALTQMNRMRNVDKTSLADNTPEDSR
ncbi:peptidoglycan-binding protein [Anabaena sp. CCY 9910]|uniref:peptidoglycan-binding protein n=1 Tax=Anabaena sp. CCY 9910 TaxID=3103870 RepID=UPI0039E03F78